MSPGIGGALAWVTEEMTKKDTELFLIEAVTPPFMHRLDLCVPCCVNVELMTKSISGIEQ